MPYRDDLDALQARHAALAGEVAARRRELEDVGRLLSDAQARRARPVLDNLRVASPCDVPWDSMTGDARVRACAQCARDVYNLTELTREEAEALILERNGALCVRYYQRYDGTVVLADCEVGARPRRRRLAVLGGVAAAAATVLAGVGGMQLAGALTDGEPPAVAPAEDDDGATTAETCPARRADGDEAPPRRGRMTQGQLAMTAEDLAAANSLLERELAAARAQRAAARVSSAEASERLTVAARARDEAAREAATAQAQLEAAQRELDLARARVDRLQALVDQRVPIDDLR